MSDVGLANERTALSWQRTALAVTAGAAIVARLTVDRLGTWALVALAVALVLGLWIFTESWLRYADQAGTRQRPARRGGRAPAVLALATVMIGATELTAIALGATGR
ncbi:DUF202 domain-containing protein [Nocardioides limicola]|uniref:DUF202 domain-containing protein n=1 Tax=Nocardioides limicola TaxID=2803368 RepID=UPI00193B87BD|nr:DUF202 domain-containing protein [Nocardioides sp. DJM-14]